jgi:outer membrane immunogenic protein
MKAKVLSAIGAIALFTGTSALAADMPVKAPPPPPPLIWSGFYIGGNIGIVSERASGTSDFLDPSAPPGESRTNPQSNSFTNTTGIGGGQIGYNWQIDPRWLVGLEADWDATRPGYSFCRQTSTTSLACTDNGDGFETISSNTKWLASARARLGFTMGNWMLYGTGGIAWGRVDTTLTENCLVFGCGSSSTALFATNTSTTTKAGWVGGVGAAVALWSNWSARAEWLHYDLGTISNTLTTAGLTGGVTPSLQTAVWSRTERYDVIRIGFDYRLPWHY